MRCKITRPLTVSHEEADLLEIQKDLLSTVPVPEAEGPDIPIAHRSMGSLSSPMGGRGDLGFVRRGNQPSDCGAEPGVSASGQGFAYHRLCRWHRGRPHSRRLSNGHCSGGHGLQPFPQDDIGRDDHPL